MPEVGVLFVARDDRDVPSYAAKGRVMDDMETVSVHDGRPSDLHSEAVDLRPGVVG